MPFVEPIRLFMNVRHWCMSALMTENSSIEATIFFINFCSEKSRSEETKDKHCRHLLIWVLICLSFYFFNTCVSRFVVGLGVSIRSVLRFIYIYPESHLTTLTLVLKIKKSFKSGMILVSLFKRVFQFCNSVLLVLAWMPFVSCLLCDVADVIRCWRWGGLKNVILNP